MEFARPTRRSDDGGMEKRWKPPTANDDESWRHRSGECRRLQVLYDQRQPAATRGRHMVRRGSTVRVRQRACRDPAWFLGLRERRSWGSGLDAPLWNRFGTAAGCSPERGPILSSSSSTSAELSFTGANGEPSPSIAADTAPVDDLLGRLEDAPDFVAERVGAIPPRAIGCARNHLQLSDHSKGGDES